MAKTKKGKNLSEEKKLAKRREQKKLSMRKARECIKNDPVKYAEIKLKDRQRYQRYKREGKIKLIDEMSHRDQRKIRKEWKLRAKNSRNSKKEEKQYNLQNSTLPERPGINEQEDFQLIARQRDVGKKQARINRDRKNNEIKNLQERLEIANRNVLKYKKRISRLNKKIKKTETPQRVVNKILEGQKVTPLIRRKLLFGEVISKQVRENYKKQTNENGKARFVACVSGAVVGKYRFVEYMRSLTSRRSLNRKGYFGRKKIEHGMKNLRQDVVKFLELDECSRMTAGKKETVTKKKLKKQKRYLNDSMQNLHAKFMKENIKYKNLSYSLFCTLRPFWITFPNISSRDTCLCKQHANMYIIVSKLKGLRIINEITPNDLIKNMCCVGELQDKCLQRKCSRCVDINVQIKEFDGNEITSYEKWVTKKVEVLVKGRVKLTQKTTKEIIQCTKNHLVDELQKSIEPFMNHCYNIRHQYKIIKTVKESLTEYEALLHFDFSQNYMCKYSSEIQSVHFGSSRQQVTLHTSVLYYLDHKERTSHKSFCTLSESLRHDPSSVCAHLDPVIKNMKEIIPNLKKVHFLSDGPSTQYRNKKMFYLLGNYLSKSLQVEEIVWHYSEAGHGKGAADGIGGSLKRMADGLVSKGTDLANFEQFESQLKRCTKDITIFSITHNQICDIDKRFPEEPLATFIGTMKIHQLTWDHEKPELIQARKLSCLTCGSGKSCLHYNIGEITIKTKTTPQSLEKTGDLCSNRLHYADVYSSDESQDGDNEAKPNDYVIVKFAGKKKLHYYVGLIIKKIGEELTVKYLKRSSGKKFVFPEIEDISTVYSNDVLAVLDQPCVNNRQQYEFFISDNYMNLL